MHLVDVCGNRNALAATVKLGFKPALDGKNEVSTT